MCDQVSKSSEWDMDGAKSKKVAVRYLRAFPCSFSWTSLAFNFAIPSTLPHNFFSFINFLFFLDPYLTWQWQKTWGPCISCWFVLCCVFFLAFIIKICQHVKSFRTRTSKKLDNMEDQLARLKSCNLSLRLCLDCLSDTDFQCRYMQLTLLVYPPLHFSCDFSFNDIPK